MNALKVDVSVDYCTAIGRNEYLRLFTQLDERSAIQKQIDYHAHK
jgi:hypothetical protein